MTLVNLGCGGRFVEGWVNIDFTSHSPFVKAHDLSKDIPLGDSTADLVYSSHFLEHLPRRRTLPFLEDCRRVLKPGGVIRIAVPDLEAIARLYLKTLEDAKAGVKGASSRHEWMTLELFDQMVREKSGGGMVDFLLREPVPEKDFVFSRLGGEARNIMQGLEAARISAGSEKTGMLTGLLKSFSTGKREDEHASESRFRRSGEAHRWMYDSLSLGSLLKKAGFRDVKEMPPSESLIPGWKGFNLDTDPDGSVYKPDSLYMEGRKG